MTTTAEKLEAAIEHAMETWHDFQSAVEARGLLEDAIETHIKSEIERLLGAAEDVKNKVEALSEASHKRGQLFSKKGDARELYDENIRAMKAEGDARRELLAAIFVDRDKAALAALDEFRKLLPGYVTPDEALRLLEQYDDAVSAFHEDIDSTRKALLRALGVEEP